MIQWSNKNPKLKKVLKADHSRRESCQQSLKHHQTPEKLYFLTLVQHRVSKLKQLSSFCLAISADCHHLCVDRRPNCWLLSLPDPVRASKVTLDYNLKVNCPSHVSSYLAFAWSYCRSSVPGSSIRTSTSYAADEPVKEKNKHKTATVWSKSSHIFRFSGKRIHRTVSWTTSFYENTKKLSIQLLIYTFVRAEPSELLGSTWTQRLPPPVYLSLPSCSAATFQNLSTLHWQAHQRISLLEQVSTKETLAGWLKSNSTRIEEALLMDKLSGCCLVFVWKVTGTLVFWGGKSIKRIPRYKANLLLCALTGYAAHNTGGTTIHELFSLRLEKNIKSQEGLKAVQEKLLNFIIMIVDEVSVVSHELMIKQHSNEWCLWFCEVTIFIFCEQTRATVRVVSPIKAKRTEDDFWVSYRKCHTPVVFVSAGNSKKHHRKQETHVS